jgi:hypothetical protein
MSSSHSNKEIYKYLKAFNLTRVHLISHLSNLIMGVVLIRTLWTKINKVAGVIKINKLKMMIITHTTNSLDFINLVST